MIKKGVNVKIVVYFSHFCHCEGRWAYSFGYSKEVALIYIVHLSQVLLLYFVFEKLYCIRILNQSWEHVKRVTVTNVYTWREWHLTIYIQSIKKDNINSFERKLHQVWSSDLCCIVRCFLKDKDDMIILYLTFSWNFSFRWPECIFSEIASYLFARVF